MEYLSKQRYDEIAAELRNLIDVFIPRSRRTLRKQAPRETGAIMPDIAKQGGPKRKPSAVSVSFRRFWIMRA